MKTSSAKSKGRRLQQQVVAALMEIGSRYGLEEGDITSTSMGVNGVDVVFSPAARRVLGDFSIECKNVERLAVLDTFVEHFAKYADKENSLKLLVHNRNLARAKKQQDIEKNVLPLVTMRLSDFLQFVAYVTSHDNDTTPKPTRVKGFANKGQLKHESDEAR